MPSNDQEISNVSSLLNLLCEMTTVLTFENFHLMSSAHPTVCQAPTATHYRTLQHNTRHQCSVTAEVHTTRYTQYISLAPQHTTHTTRTAINKAHNAHRNTQYMPNAPTATHHTQHTPNKINFTQCVDAV